MALDSGFIKTEFDVVLLIWSASAAKVLVFENGFEYEHGFGAGNWFDNNCVGVGFEFEEYRQDGNLVDDNDDGEKGVVNEEVEEDEE